MSNPFVAIATFADAVRDTRKRRQRVMHWIGRAMAEFVNEQP